MTMRTLIFLIALMMTAAPSAFAQASKGSTPDLTGVYELVPNDVTLPGGLKNAGSPEEISLLPAAAAKAKATDLSLDTAKDCQIIGPFRMMAWEGTKMDLLPSPNTGRMFMLFENYYLGLFREIILDRPHDPNRIQRFAIQDLDADDRVVQRLDVLLEERRAVGAEVRRRRLAV